MHRAESAILDGQLEFGYGLAIFDQVNVSANELVDVFIPASLVDV